MTRAPLQRGFTLIEVVVAVLLVGIMAIMIGSIVSSFKLTRSAAHEELALRIASTELDTLRASGYDALPASGSFSSTQLASLPGGSGTITVAVLNAKTKQVTVTVSWTETGTARSVSLATYITQTGGL